MMGAVRLSHHLGLVGEEVVIRQEGLFKAFGLPTTCPGVPLGPIIEAMELDKKVREAEVRWVLLEDIGRATTQHRVPQEEVQAVLQELTK
jgi:3-dehydroquinate synthase